jgi:NADH-quinone oxidoreductase subunit H
MNVITMSAIMVTLFLGGPQPFEIAGLDVFGWAGPLTGTLWVLLKTLGFLYVYVWFRATLPRLRYDQLMDFGWKLLIPVALGWFLVLAALEMVRDRYDGWEPLAVTVALSLFVLGISYALFSAALAVARRNRETEGAAY